MEIIIADDHKMVRKGIKLILEAAYPGIFVEEADDGVQLVKKVSQKKWDIIIADISMPGRSGVDVVKDIKQISPETPILILSTHPAEQYAIRIIKAGVSCYLTKESAPEELVEAVESLRHGRKYFTDEVVNLLAHKIDDRGGEKPHERLTDKEFDIMKQLAQGKSVTQISHSFSISKNTVSTYKARIFEKMQVMHVADLIRYAVDHQL